MIDKRLIGREFPSHSVNVHKEQILFFARAIGETHPVYTDEEYAKAQGYAGLPAPPTYAFSLGLAQGDIDQKYKNLGIDPARILHAEQEFDYCGLILAGDCVTVSSRIKDVFDKKNGALSFIKEEFTIANRDGGVVIRYCQTLVVQNGP